MNTVQHLEMKQVGARVGERMGEGREEMEERGRKEGERWVMAVCELLSALCVPDNTMQHLEVKQVGARVGGRNE